MVRTRTARLATFVQILATALAVLALTGCGSSSTSSGDSAAISTCVHQGASKAACSCALTYAKAHGDTAEKLQREMANKTAINDPVAVKAGISCAGAH